MWRGFAYPARTSDKGFFDDAENDGLIRGNIMQIIGTRKGERVMLPLFGTRVWEYIHEPLDAATIQFLRMELISAITEWEPRAILRDVIMREMRERNILKARILYSTAQSDERQTFDLAIDKSGSVSRWV
ncbi:MAG: GPW/gp25 family protein [Synergistaceae bacterium]|jgi:phage baseplate assembly protein W|nr:GPW/gp25 family protein [Synergistaceae bacterium]